MGVIRPSTLLLLVSLEMHLWQLGEGRDVLIKACPSVTTRVLSSFSLRGEKHEYLTYMEKATINHNGWLLTDCSHLIITEVL